MNKSIKLFAPAALIVLASSVAGCTAGAGQQATASDIVQKVRDTMKTTQSVQGTVDLSLTLNKQGIQTLVSGFMPTGGNATGGAEGAGGKDWVSKLPDTASMQVKLWKQAPTGTTPAKARIEVVSSSLPGVSGVTFVYDGAKAYALDPARHVMYTGTPDKLAQKLPDEMKAALSGVDVDKEIDIALSAADVKLTGTEQVAGVDAYKLDITPKPDAAATLGLPKAMQMQAGVLIKDLHMSLWVDKSRSIPVKLVVEHPNIGQFTSTASALDLNKAIDPSEFVLQVGPDTRQVDLDKMADNMTPQKLTLPAARDLAAKQGWKLLEATYPAGVTVVDVTSGMSGISGMMGNGMMGKGMMRADMEGADKYSTGNGELWAVTMGANDANQAMHNSAVTISYSSPSTDFTVTEARVELPKGLGDGFSGMNNRDNSTGALKHVTVRGTDAIAFSPAANGAAAWTSLLWREKDSGVFVAIRGKLSVDEAVKVAEGLK